MVSLIYSFKNPRNIIWFILLFVLLFFYDTLWDLLLMLLHSVLMLLHILFEFSEHALDEFIQHLFHTDPRTTQIIVFYIMACIIGYILFKLVRALPRWYRTICNRLTRCWHQEKAKAISQWQNQPIFEKIKWGTVFITSSFFMIFWVLNY